MEVEIKKIQKKWLAKKVEADLSFGHPTIGVALIYVDAEHRGKGLASKFLNELCKYADKRKYDIVLQVAGFENSSIRGHKLREFYIKRGFKSYGYGTWKLLRQPKEK